tara:strand:+ start:125 stop:559 length:435 start_codon:yes stop_codon:yes gene_type:complete
MKIAINISERLKQLIGSKPVLLGSNDENVIGEIKMGLDAKWTEMKDIAQQDIVSLIESEKSYGDSWKRRGGTGAFMMLARKFDRIEQQAESCNYDVFEAGAKFNGEDGLLDDIGDLRRYLFLVEHHIRYGIGDIDPDADTTHSA